MPAVVDKQLQYLFSIILSRIQTYLPKINRVYRLVTTASFYFFGACKAFLQRRKRAKWLTGVTSEILKDLEEYFPKATHAVDHRAMGWTYESKLEPMKEHLKSFHLEDFYGIHLALVIHFKDSSLTTAFTEYSETLVDKERFKLKDE